MGSLTDEIFVETDLFEHRTVQSHFINDCCFGEDFAAWIKHEAVPLAVEGFKFSEPIQEDYGWGLVASRGGEDFWIAFSYMGDGPQEEPARWTISISYETGLDLLKYMFPRPDQVSFRLLRDHVWRAIRANSSLTVIAGGR
jgi:hypothetical protein